MGASHGIKGHAFEALQSDVQRLFTSDDANLTHGATHSLAVTAVPSQLRQRHTAFLTTVLSGFQSDADSVLAPEMTRDELPPNGTVLHVNGLQPNEIRAVVPLDQDPHDGMFYLDSSSAQNMGKKLPKSLGGTGAG
mmetsp:Transcript_59650/g.141941  ORF Transcript_59650/g.141941 Transcript_59650/m.141941 type:complete len:136 (-) Transcript_59650:49-456(-)